MAVSHNSIKKVVLASDIFHDRLRSLNIPNEGPEASSLLDGHTAVLEEALNSLAGKRRAGDSAAMSLSSLYRRLAADGHLNENVADECACTDAHHLSKLTVLWREVREAVNSAGTVHLRG